MGVPALRPMGPAARLRDESAVIHRQTEEEPFIVELMSGGRDAAAYATLAGQLRWVYAALEAEVAAARSTARAEIAALLDPVLDRVPALDHDLAILAGQPAPTLAPPLPATSAYVERIRAAAPSWPRLLAHHYVRYLGDLSGGQIVATMLRRHYAIPDAALTFFAFDRIESKGGYKTRYRAALDALLTDPADYAAMLDETLAAYAANRAMFAALGQPAV